MVLPCIDALSLARCAAIAVSSPRKTTRCSLHAIHAELVLHISSVQQTVFIEDTDTFGVVYYANYLRFYERAAAEVVGLDRCAHAMREGGVIGTDSVRSMKYSAGAVLGDELRLRVMQHPGCDSLGRLSFDMVLMRADGTELNACTDLRVGFRSRSNGLLEPMPSRLGLKVNSEIGSFGADEIEPPGAECSPPIACTTRLQGDELGGFGGLSLHGAMRYFERHRTTFIGGPDAL
eukprot:CAMPEP_0119300462 /NCGR_PEP_ID=MMETSP1333-20130426/2403_1 /TAXON_ID=418940 /ORGANISM="Scyphosphaera apsteinii, Strain RCC1455" /LENGTH=233 /DNA_ID=CAMNT_0007302239 /DNA_START=126 /DNA_END=824 /DNA_ORIENTATION=-